MKNIDHTSFAENGVPPKRPAGEAIDPQWWTLEGDKAAKSITGTLLLLDQAQRPRTDLYIAGTRLYGNAPALGYAGFGGPLQGNGASSATFGKWSDKITYNVVQSATDTITAKIGKNKPRPFFLPSGGDYRSHRKAKRLNKFCDGLFYENKVYALGPMIFRDGAVWGDGIAKVFEKNKRVCIERCLPNEIFVDEVEALLGNPRQMHHVRYVDRRNLEARFPEYAAQIATADQAKFVSLGARANVSDQVMVRESWHLPSGPDAKDGKHIVTIEQYAISDMGEWNHDFFPFARFRWCPRLVGYWSQSLAEQLKPTQIELNRLMGVIQKATYKAGTFTTWVPKGSNVPKDYITNATDSVIEYTGTVAPHRDVNPIVPPEVYRQVEQHKRDAFELAGVSLLSAGAQKPAGLDSKVALREFSDIESDRFRTIGAEYENFFLELARLGLACARDIAKKHGGKYQVTARGRGAMEEVSWSKIGLEENEYGMECFPVSSLPRDPAGRLQTIQEYAQAGYLTPREARRLLDFPDLESVESLANAAEDWLVQCLDKIVDDGEFTGPDPLDDLKLARELALQYYAVGKAKGLDTDRIEMLRRFLMQIDALELAAAKKAAQQQAAMAAPPGLTSIPGGLAAPTAPPVPPAPSPLVPNAAGPALRAA